MTEGWKLKEGSAVYSTVSDDELWTVTMKVLSSQTMKTTSYKYALLRAFLENLYKANGRLELSFDQLAESFAKLYWNLVIRNGYSQGHQAQIEKDLKDLQVKFTIPEGVSFEALQESHQAELVQRVENNILKKYVVGALYADTNGLLYGFSKKDRKVVLTPSSYEFLLKYQTTVFKLANYELAKFLQKKNPYLTQGILLDEIENITQRESLKQFQQLIVAHSGSFCFYTDKPLLQTHRTIAVDHFVPWSFVHSDELWNFVLTSTQLNSRKGSKLPAEPYLEKLHERNQLFKQNGDIYVKQYMENYSFQQFVRLYGYAELNGFKKGWLP
ncbi:HNH endonuclease domain-containing protein [Planococcus sp. ISL-110]|uniref:HNH endonuclease domain-containing protein n=1 Tax=Planococcus sp. ISL-110 TaxID=2819167 RepID=UPI001BE59D04|nr:HNH endonuclease domain-containing protein [Planococcus sp. ISL-110]MBT2571537.1 HNH endonuclease [Planococcus sp. ISL-110]